MTSHLIELRSRADTTFARFKPMEKRALPNFVLSNATLSNDRVLYTEKFSFSEVLKYGHRSTMPPRLGLVTQRIQRGVAEDFCK